MARTVIMTAGARNSSLVRTDGLLIFSKPLPKIAPKAAAFAHAKTLRDSQTRMEIAVQLMQIMIASAGIHMLSNLDMRLNETQTRL